MRNQISALLSLLGTDIFSSICLKMEPFDSIQTQNVWTKQVCIHWTMNIVWIKKSATAFNREKERERNMSKSMEYITKWNSFKVYIGIWALDEFSVWKTLAIIHQEMRTVINEQKQMCLCIMATIVNERNVHTFVNERGWYNTNHSSGKMCVCVSLSRGFPQFYLCFIYNIHTKSQHSNQNSDIHSDKCTKSNLSLFWKWASLGVPPKLTSRK